MQIRMTFLTVALVLMMGCGGTRGAIRKISEENKKNFVLADDLTKDIHVIWDQVSGAFEASKDLLPPPITKRVKLINKIFLNKKISEVSKRDRSTAGVHFLFLLNDSARLAYRAFAPDVLNLLKLMGLL